jgi:anti-anti-sigma regulatory factor
MLSALCANTMTGPLDLTATPTTVDLRAALRGALDARPRSLLVMAAKVACLDDSCLAVLLTAAAHARRRGTTCFVIDPSRATQAVLAAAEAGRQLVVIGHLEIRTRAGCLFA